MAIAIVLSAVASSASALFSSTATVSGVTFSTGNANLQVWNGSAWDDDYSPSNFLFTSMYPGFNNFKSFSLRNSSTSNIKLTLNAKLANGATQSPAGAWDILKDVVEARFTNADGTVPLTSWRTINYWNSTGANFDTGINPGENRWYRIQVRIPSSAGNEISNASLADMKFDFTGTQE